MVCLEKRDYSDHCWSNVWPECSMQLGSMEDSVSTQRDERDVGMGDERKSKGRESLNRNPAVYQ